MILSGFRGSVLSYGLTISMILFPLISVQESLSNDSSYFSQNIVSYKVFLLFYCTKSLSLNVVFLMFSFRSPKLCEYPQIFFTSSPAVI